MDAAFLASVVEQARQPIFVKDHEGRFVFVNQAMCDIIGAPQEQIVGKKDADFVRPAEAAQLRKSDKVVLTTGKPVTIERELITDIAGRRRVLTTSKAPLRDAQGKVTHIVGMIHDVCPLADGPLDLDEVLDPRSERRPLAKPVQEDLVRAERLTVLGQLAGGLAHQIRNPLAAITNAAYVLQRTLAASPQTEQARATEIILEEAWKANRIITGLIDYAKARPGLRIPCRIRKVIQQALAARPVPAHIQLQLSLDDLPTVVVDPDQLREAMANLVQNAIESMPTEGRLHVHGRVEEGSVIVCVQDSGTGIAPEVQKRLFQPLITTKPQGLGLGLTTARMLIEGQDGSISFKSVVGEGTVFEVRIPQAPGDVLDPPDSEPEPGSP